MSSEIPVTDTPQTKKEIRLALKDLTVVLSEHTVPSQTVPTDANIVIEPRDGFPDELVVTWVV